MKKNKNNQGFTLIELMIVVVIIGILATIAISYFKRQIETAKLHVVRSALYEVKKSIEIYAILNDGKYPLDTRGDRVPPDLGVRTDAFILKFFGGHLEYEGPDRNPYVGIAVYINGDEFLMRHLDAMMDDDGDLSKGKFRRDRRGVYIYIIVE